MSISSRGITHVAKAVGIDGAACIAVLALAAWSSFEVVARDLESRWSAQLKFLYCAGPLVLYAVLVGVVVLFLRENREPRNQGSRTRLTLILLGIAFYFAVMIGTSSESPLWWLLSGRESIFFYLSQSGFVFLLVLFFLFLALYFVLLRSVISAWRRATGTRGRGNRTILFALLLGVAFYFVSSSYFEYAYFANYLEIHCRGHQPCK